MTAGLVENLPTRQSVHQAREQVSKGDRPLAEILSPFR